ncbi:hypothetical protein HDU76_009720 [Blyttiomyces sp. JEL0837]|nr:hypothetical protein HDU76_009720 [Blyttiomyces sp. JEL0837]
MNFSDPLQPHQYQQYLSPSNQNDDSLHTPPSTPIPSPHNNNNNKNNEILSRCPVCTRSIELSALLSAPTVIASHFWSLPVNLKFGDGTSTSGNTAAWFKKMFSSRKGSSANNSGEGGDEVGEFASGGSWSSILRKKKRGRAGVQKGDGGVVVGGSGSTVVVDGESGQAQEPAQAQEQAQSGSTLLKAEGVPVRVDLEIGDVSAEGGSVSDDVVAPVGVVVDDTNVKGQNSSVVRFSEVHDIADIGVNEKSDEEADDEEENEKKEKEEKEDDEEENDEPSSRAIVENADSDDVARALFTSADTVVYNDRVNVDDAEDNENNDGDDEENLDPIARIKKGLKMKTAGGKKNGGKDGKGGVWESLKDKMKFRGARVQNGNLVV